MKCTETDCDQPAEYRYQWSWGALGACCGMHQQHVQSRAQQLGAVLALVPIPVHKDELAGALERVRDVAVRLRKRIEEGGAAEPDTAELGEELARRVRNAPRPVGDTLLAIREVGTALVNQAEHNARNAQQSASLAHTSLAQIQGLLLASEAQITKLRDEHDLQIYNVRKELERQQARVFELESAADLGPDPSPPPQTLPPQQLPQRPGGEGLAEIWRKPEDGNPDDEPTLDDHPRKAL